MFVCYELQKVAHSRLVPLYSTHFSPLLFYVACTSRPCPGLQLRLYLFLAFSSLV